MSLLLETKQIATNHNYWGHITNPIAATVGRSFIYQESILGPRGGAAVATEAMTCSFEEQLGIHMAIGTLAPSVHLVEFPFAVDFMQLPLDSNGKKYSNEELAEILGNPQNEYIEYAMRLMNGTDVIMPNYWVAGTLAVRAREEMEQRAKNNVPLYYDNGIPVHASKIPKVIYCNHSLPGRADEELTRRAAKGKPVKAMDHRRHAFQEEVYKKADAIIVWTDAEIELSREVYPDMPDLTEKMVKVSPPFNYDVQKAHNERPALRKQYLGDDATENTLVYYFQGRLVEYKRPEIALEGFIQTYQTLYCQTGKEPDIAFVMVGDGPMETLLKETIQQLDPNIAQKIKMIGHQDAHVGHSLGDVHINPTIKESFGYSNVEAAMTGRAVISADIGTVMEANGPGALYRHDQDGYTQAMIQLYDPEIRAQKRYELFTYVQQYTEEATALGLQHALQVAGV